MPLDFSTPLADESPSRLVELAGVSVTIDRTPVLRSLSMAVAAGEAVGVIGANGSGKSTLLRVLATLLAPVAGSGHVLGARLGTRGVEQVRPAVALVGHTAALYPQLTLAENLRFFCRLTGRSPDAAERALAVVGLAQAADRPAERCSQGMLRRTDLARVMVAAPRLLLLDEAHAGLDHASAGLVDVVVEGVRRRGGGVVVVSHEADRLRETVDRVVEIDDGTLRPADRLLHLPKEGAR